jgi:hypothetical protein
MTMTPATTTSSDSPEANRQLLENATWDLGRGTHVRIKRIGDVVDQPRGDGRMSVDFDFVSRGRQSRLAVRRFLQRLVISSLVCKIAECDTAVATKWVRRAARERVWLKRNLRLLA